MKESIGYTVTLNIVITFIVIVFAFIAGSLSYFKANKINKMIIDSIEKYEGYNELSEKDIISKISSLGYNMSNMNCSHVPSDCKRLNTDVKVENAWGSRGYCIYICEETDYYYYKIGTNMLMNIPIINDIVRLPIYATTNRLYDFEK